MKAKTTPTIFFNKDFAISTLKAAVSNYFLLAILFAVFSFDGFAQANPLHNGRTIIEGYRGFQVGTPYLENRAGFNPFNTQSNSIAGSNKSSRTQMIYALNEFTNSGATEGTITRIAFKVSKMGLNETFNCSDFTIRFAQTNLPSFENQNDRFIPADMVLTEARTGPLSLTVADFEADGSGGWLTIVLQEPYVYNLNNGQNLIVDISKTLASTGNYWNNANQRVYYPKYTTSTAFYGVRSCYGTFPGILPDGKLMHSGPNPSDFSSNTVTDNGLQSNRLARPFTKFTYLASVSNTKALQYPDAPTSAICYGDPISFGVKNMYGTGYLALQWRQSNAPASGFSDVEGQTGLVLSTTQAAEKLYYRLQVTVPGGSSYYDGYAHAIVPGIKTYETSGWVDGLSPAAGESAHFKANPGWTTNQLLDLCSIKVADGVDMTVPAGSTLKLDRPIKDGDIEGTLTFENNSALLQNTNAANTAENVTYKRTTAPILRYDYTYYSSPVEGMNLFALSPGTLTDKFYSYQNNEWFMENASTTMLPGVGYIIRAPQTFNISGTKVPFGAGFTGKPNNGNIISPISPVVDHYNLVGNPYPSAVNIFPFVLQNDFLDGNIYLWDHISAPSTIYPGTATYNYNNSDYFAANVLGTPNGPTNFLVAAGQSFMIKTTTAAISAALWTNNMRVGNTDVVFHKVQNSNLKSPQVSAVADAATNFATESAGRFWLELQANNGAVQRMLVGFIEGATDGNDRLYDAAPMEIGSTALYAIGSDQQPLSIVGKGLPFNDEQIIPLGFATAVAGNHTILKFLEDGFMSNYSVYINDKLTNTVHNLSEGSYTFATGAGTFNDRFIIAFKAKKIPTVNNTVKGNTVVIFDKMEAIQLHSGEAIMKNVVIYDLSGRVLARVANCNSAEVALSTLPRKNQLLVVEIQLENGTVETQKFRF